MSIWFFILLGIACALVLGPIATLRPNPAQRRKEQLRLRASTKGLRFSMRRLPALKTDPDQPIALPVYYFPPHSNTLDAEEWILMRTHYAHESNFYAEWDWQSNVRPDDTICELLRIYLPQLPASILAVSHGNLGTCVFWLEKEGEETLDLLVDLLTKLHRLTAGSPP